MPAWIKKVEKLKRKCRVKNPRFLKMRNRLVVDCWKAAVFRLKGAAKQIGKMRQFLPEKKLKYASATLKLANAALKPLNRIYKRKKPPAKKPKRGLVGKTVPTRSSASR